MTETFKCGDRVVRVGHDGVWKVRALYFESATSNKITHYVIVKEGATARVRVLPSEIITAPEQTKP